MIERTYLGTECWSCGIRYDNNCGGWPYCINCGSPAWESLNNGQRQHLQDVLDKQKQVYDTARAELKTSQQRVAELKTALKAIGNMAYTALYIVPDIRDRDLDSLEHACQRILAKVREFDEEDGPAGGGE